MKRHRISYRMERLRFSRSSAWVFDPGQHQDRLDWLVLFTIDQSQHRR
jgi:hypothetical protein